MEKFYHSNSNMSFTCYDKHGAEYHVKFVSSINGSELLTDNEGVQEAIENSMYFKEKRIRLVFSRNNNTEEEENTDDGMEAVYGISNYTDAKLYVMERFGCSAKSVINPAAIRSVAKKNGIKFVNWK